MPPEQRKALKDIVACRTAALGGHVKQCDQCGHIEVFYDSCRNRHCPKCQAAARAEWMEARASSRGSPVVGSLPLREWANRWSFFFVRTP